MDIVTEIDALRVKFMSAYAAVNHQMANVTLRLFGHLLSEYGEKGWEDSGQYHTLTNAHLLRVLHASGIKLSDRWNYGSSAPGGNLHARLP